MNDLAPVALLAPPDEDYGRSGIVAGLREQPHNIEAEQALLGNIMLEPQAIREIRFLTPDHFYDPVNGQMFQRLGELIQANRPVDPISFVRAFADDPELKKLPGGAKGHLRAIARAAETIVSPAECAREIVDLSLKRCLIKAAEETIKRAYDGSLLETGTQLLTDSANSLGQLRQAFSADHAFGFVAHEDLEQDLSLRPFLVDKWIPLGCVTSLYGSGGTGKSFLAMMLGMCVAAGMNWLGYPCQQAIVLGLMCEDDEDELKRRRNRIARALNIRREDIEGRLFLSPRIGMPNALMEFPGGIAARTPLFEQIVSEARRLGARLIILDNAAQLFAGNENDRAQVTAFLNAVGGIACEVNGAVLLLGHPPKTQNIEFSGSTAWDAVVRSRIWFKRAKDAEGVEDEGRYTLELVKSNYARRFGIEIAENGHGVVEYVKDIEPAAQKRKTNSDRTLDVLFTLYGTFRRAVALDEVVAECIRIGIVAEAEPNTPQWRDRRRTVRAHLHLAKDRVDDRGNETYAIKPA